MRTVIPAARAAPGPIRALQSPSRNYPGVFVRSSARRGVSVAATSRPRSSRRRRHRSASPPAQRPSATPSPWQPAPVDVRDAEVRGGGAGASGEARQGQQGEATELIFNLFNRGSGWGEEIIPHITVEKRAITKAPGKALQVCSHPLCPRPAHDCDVTVRSSMRHYSGHCSVGFARPQRR